MHALASVQAAEHPRLDFCTIPSFRPTIGRKGDRFRKSGIEVFRLRVHEAINGRTGHARHLEKIGQANEEQRVFQIHDELQGVDHAPRPPEVESVLDQLDSA